MLPSRRTRLSKDRMCTEAGEKTDQPELRGSTEGEEEGEKSESLMM
jgi:hypothetical protein